MNVGTFKKIDSEDCLPPSASDLLPFQTNHIPDWVRQKATKELNETEENKAYCLQKLKELISADETLSGIAFQDDFLVQFLRHKKYAVSGAFNHVRRCAEFSARHPEILENVPVEYVDINEACGALCIMPRRCPEGCAIVFYRIGQWEVDDIPQPVVERLIMLMYMHLSRDPVSQINGVKIVIDCKGMTMRHLTYGTPSNITTFYNFSTHWLTCRWRGFHIINGNEAMRLMFAVAIKFSEKLQKRIFFHSSLEELHAAIPPCVLPVGYGGTVEDLQVTRDWLRNANEEHRKMTPGGMTNIY